MHDVDVLKDRLIKHPNVDRSPADDTSTAVEVRVPDPATLVDTHGRIVVWALPSLLEPDHQVGFSVYPFVCA